MLTVWRFSLRSALVAGGTEADGTTGKGRQGLWSGSKVLDLPTEHKSSRGEPRRSRSIIKIERIKLKALACISCPKTVKCRCRSATSCLSEVPSTAPPATSAARAPLSRTSKANLLQRGRYRTFSVFIRRYSTFFRGFPTFFDVLRRCFCCHDGGFKPRWQRNSSSTGGRVLPTNKEDGRSVHACACMATNPSALENSRTPKPKHA